MFLHRTFSLFLFARLLQQRNETKPNACWTFTVDARGRLPPSNFGYSRARERFFLYFHMNLDSPYNDVVFLKKKKGTVVQGNEFLEKIEKFAAATQLNEKRESGARFELRTYGHSES